MATSSPCTAWLPCGRRKAAKSTGPAGRRIADRCVTRQRTLNRRWFPHSTTLGNGSSFGVVAIRPGGSTTMISFRPEGTKVILLGASVFPQDPIRLQELPAVRRNIVALRNIFEDPEMIGIPAQNIYEMVDQGTSGEIAAAIAKAAKGASEGLIFYYAGHGLIALNSGDFILATRDTSEEYAAYNGLPFEKIRQAIADSPARKKLLILDCCFSGRALQGAMGTEAAAQAASIDVKGTYSIAAAPSNALASAPIGERYTAFSGALIQTLYNGVEAKKEFLSLEDIFQEVRRTLRGMHGVPEPQRQNFQDAEQLLLARNCWDDRQARQTLAQLKRNYEVRIRDLEGQLSEADITETARLRSTLAQRDDEIKEMRSTLQKSGSVLPIDDSESVERPSAISRRLTSFRIWIAVLVGGVAIWELGSLVFKDYLPSPAATLSSISAETLVDAIKTTGFAIAGILVGIIIGIPVLVIFGWLRPYIGVRLDKSYCLFASVISLPILGVWFRITGTTIMFITLVTFIQTICSEIGYNMPLKIDMIVRGLAKQFPRIVLFGFMACMLAEFHGNSLYDGLGIYMAQALREPDLDKGLAAFLVAMVAGALLYFGATLLSARISSYAR
jgi:ABC-type nitrate/sulfonate/bicarbonate transport system permease component